MDENHANVASPFLSMEEVSKLLNISRYCVAQAIARGELQYVRIGKKVRISQGQLQEFLRKNAYPKSDSSVDEA